MNVEGLLREYAPQALAVVVHRSSDFYAAEDATQEALLKAAQRWPVEGVPTQPLAWLVTTAVNALTDTARSETRRRVRETKFFQESPLDNGAVEQHDATLTLLFMCCHEALTPASAIALTLRAVAGLTTADIAHAFLVPEATMAQRISRAKRRVADAGATFAPPLDLREDPRTETVLQALYLMFNEGYVTSHGDSLNRPSLTAEAVRLTRLVHRLHPDAADLRGLLSLMLLTDARRPARTRADGSLVPLGEQDRSLWDKALIIEGMGLLLSTSGDVMVSSPYLLQAAIAATHDCSLSVDTTDWPQILALYAALERHTPTAVVRLNKAVATAMVHGPRAGLALVEALEADLAGYHRVAAVRGHLLEMAGDLPNAAATYASAARASKSIAERDYLTTKAANLGTRGLSPATWPRAPQPPK